MNGRLRGKEDGERGNGDTNYWILCSFCSSWYHISCLMIDNAYACAALTFTCPDCGKAALDGLSNFIYHYRNYPVAEIDVHNIIEQWTELTLCAKDTVRRHIYPFIDIFERVNIGPIRILCGRGITNLYNNCWASLIFHVLCGTIISRLLTFSSKKGQNDILADLIAIARDLQSSAGALQFTSAMKRLTRRIMGCYQPLVRK